MKTVWQERVLYFIFTAILAVLLIDSLGEFGGLAWARHIVFDYAKIFLPVILLMMHCVYSLFLKRGLALIFFICSCGLIAEIIGLKTGLLFGSHYRYNPDSLLMFSRLPLFGQGMFFCGVPLLVVFYWAVFIYAGYSISNSFLFWQGQGKPSHQAKNTALLVKLILLDAFIVLALDLVMDPVLVNAGNWAWHKPGAYFGVPAGNFLGWFAVAIVLSGAFRIFEYNFPDQIKKLTPLPILFPVLSLSVVFILAVGIALYKSLYLLIPVAVFTMLPVILANFYLFFTGRNGLAYYSAGKR